MIKIQRNFKEIQRDEEESQVGSGEGEVVPLAVISNKQLQFWRSVSCFFLTFIDFSSMNIEVLIMVSFIYLQLMKIV
jgi:hypothetical protein